MKKLLLILTAVLTVAITGCESGDINEGSYPYAVRMTDAPAAYDAIYIDLQSVVVTGANGSDVMLDVNRGIYNLLDFTNGRDTLVASGVLTTGRVEQIRFILGPNNSIVVDGVTHPLSTPSAEQSGLKLQVHQDLVAGVLYTVLIDFDANKSIVQTGNGSYKLKPVLRTIETAISGSISGNIAPAGSYAVITATSVSTGISYTATVSPTGYFLVQGLAAGEYTVTVTPLPPFSPITQTDVMVTIGATTNIGTVNL